MEQLLDFFFLHTFFSHKEVRLGCSFFHTLPSPSAAQMEVKEKQAKVQRLESELQQLQEEHEQKLARSDIIWAKTGAADWQPVAVW